MMLAKLFRTGAGNHASFYSCNRCRCGDDLFQCARRCIGADCNNPKRRWTLLDIIGAVGPRTGAIPAQGARYEDTCVDRCTALDRLAGRRAATATTGAWCRRPDKQFDPSKQRPYMYRGNGCDFLQPTHRPEPRGLRIEHRVFGIERHVWNQRRLRIERRGRSWCRLKQWY
jgi:hypothetical protein